MQIKTAYFGEIEIEECSIIEFPEGLPAFEELKRFTIIDTEEEQPFRWLQSIDREEISFIIINPFLFKSDYEFVIPDAVIEKLKIESKEDILIYTIVVVPDNVADITANLLAPIVLNIKENLGKQIVLEGNVYHTKHKIIEEVAE